MSKKVGKEGRREGGRRKEGRREGRKGKEREGRKEGKSRKGTERSIESIVLVSRHTMHWLAPIKARLFIHELWQIRRNYHIKGSVS